MDERREIDNDNERKAITAVGCALTLGMLGVMALIAGLGWLLGFLVD